MHALKERFDNQVCINYIGSLACVFFTNRDVIDCRFERQLFMIFNHIKLFFISWEIASYEIKSTPHSEQSSLWMRTLRATQECVR